MSANLPKPRYAAPCNGCGLCCKLEVCRPGRMALAASGFREVQTPCPYLVERAGLHRCALVITEEAAIERGEVEEALISRALGIGWGCTMEDEEANAA